MDSSNNNMEETRRHICISIYEKVDMRMQGASLISKPLPSQRTFIRNNGGCAIEILQPISVCFAGTKQFQYKFISTPSNGRQISHIVSGERERNGKSVFPALRKAILSVDGYP